MEIFDLIKECIDYKAEKIHVSILVEVIKDKENGDFEIVPANKRKYYEKAQARCDAIVKDSLFSELNVDDNGLKYEFDVETKNINNCLSQIKNMISGMTCDVFCHYRPTEILFKITYHKEILIKDIRKDLKLFFKY